MTTSPNSRVVAPTSRGDHVRRPGAVAARLEHRARERLRSASLAEALAEHERRGEQHRGGIRHALTRDLLGRAVRGREDARADAGEPARRRHARIGDAGRRRRTTAPRTGPARRRRRSDRARRQDPARPARPPAPRSCTPSCRAASERKSHVQRTSPPTEVTRARLERATSKARASVHSTAVSWSGLMTVTAPREGYATRSMRACRSSSDSTPARAGSCAAATRIASASSVACRVDCGKAWP